MTNYPVLVIEDVDDIRIRYLQWLKRADVPAEGAGSFKEAMLKISRQTYSVAIVDINLQDARNDVGDRSGIDIIRAIKAMGENTKCLVVTAQKDIETAVGSFKAGMDDILQKVDVGSDPNLLIDRVRSLIESDDLEVLGPHSRLHAYLCHPDVIDSWGYSRLSALNVSASQFREITSLAFSRILPVRRKKNTSYSLNVEADGHSLFGEFWSRGISRAVRIRIARHLPDELIGESRNEIILDKTKFGARIVVEVLQSLGRDDFEDGY